MRKTGRQEGGAEVIVTLRLPLQMSKKLNEFVEETRRRTMGMPFTRSDAIRQAVRELLERASKGGRT